MNVGPRYITIFLPLLFLSAVVSDFPAHGLNRPDLSSDSLSPQLVSVSEILEHEELYLGKQIRVRGKLQNIGTNYFTDLRVVLMDFAAQDDGTDAFIYVRPWLPRSFPPGHSAPRVQRKTLSHYLGRTVELTAVLKHALLKHVGEVRVLEVESAQIVELE